MNRYVVRTGTSLTARWIVLLGALAAALAGPRVWPQVQAPTPAADPATAPLLAAQQAFTRKEWKSAAELSKSAAKSAISPTARITALRIESKAEVNLNEFPAADRTLRTLLALQPNDAASLYLLGFTLLRENDPRQSLQMFNRAAALEPPTANDLKLVALNYVLLDDYPDALHWLERCVASDPLNNEAWYDLGRAQMHEGQFTHAEASFQKALALKPKDVKALDNLGLALEAQNRPEDALRSYVAAIDAQENNAVEKTGLSKGDASGMQRPSEQPLLNYGTLLNTRSNFAEASRVLTRATQITPANPRCWEELARAELGEGHYAEARGAMERAVSLDANNPRLHYQLARIYRTLDMKDPSDREFARSAALYGDKSSTPEP